MINQWDAGPLGVDNVIEAQWGREGLERMAPLRSLKDRGIPFHIEGTSPEETEDYRLGTSKRRSPASTATAASSRRGRPWTGRRLLALTRWAARFIGAEKELGSIRPGMLADLVVFDGNIMEAPIERLHELRPC